MEMEEREKDIRIIIGVGVLRNQSQKYRLA